MANRDIQKSCHLIKHLEEENTKTQKDQIIHQFIQGFADSRKKEYKHLKETNLACLKMIEARISEEPNVNCLLLKYKDDPWIKKILISYILWKICHHAALLDIDHSQPKKPFRTFKKVRY